ncbi:hypothetical protein IDH44_08980 [Paenibacillus sp. IB182496]|uniref:Uncharacterized protein n=1 Tax=Paenibacillus sabuli TaxID=2772509 RepID=A0A927BRB4_9BACL|nr:hypothetical protein [Paenibacillus sabuli]MBD2845322.1 hypothetical protein [Paenibacillus sabuli]
MMNIHPSFPHYTDYDPLVPVRCVTPDEGGLHRFFDTALYFNDVDTAHWEPQVVRIDPFPASVVRTTAEMRR